MTAPDRATAADPALTRRGFVRRASTTLAGGALAAQLADVASAHPGGSDVLRVGVVGCGGRGRGAASDILNAAKQLTDAGEPAGVRVEIVALADAFLGQVERCARQLRREHGELINVPDERKFAGLTAYEGVLAADCDLVILATPPGFRPAQFDASIEAGKHVFMEKPVAVDAPGIRRVLAVGERAAARGLAVGVGLQRRHDPKYVEAVDRLRSGAIGDILLSRVYWNSSGVWVRSRADFARAFRRKPTELEYQVYNWYYFNWLSGDHIVEQHIHNLDVSNWVRDAHPASANGMGGREIRNGREHGQIFDHHFVEFTYADGTTMMSQCRHQPGCWKTVEENFHGAAGTAELGGNKPCTVTGPDGPLAYAGPGANPYVQEHVDLLRSIHEGRPLNESRHGAEATMTAILGRMATYTGRVVTWDEAIASDDVLAPNPLVSWDDAAPVAPGEDGRYPTPVPGVKVAV